MLRKRKEKSLSIQVGEESNERAWQGADPNR
jgi:hypothetical protein